MGAQESQTEKGTRTQYKNTQNQKRGNREVYHRADTDPACYRSDIHFKEGCYPASLCSSGPSALIKDPSFNSNTPVIRQGWQRQMTNHISFDEQQHQKNIYEKWYPLLMHNSLPHFPGPQTLGDFKCKQVSSQEYTEQLLTGPSSSENKSSQVSSLRLSSASLERSVPHLSGYSHVHNVRPPSFTENAGMVAYLQCSQTLDDLFNPELKINSEKYSSSSGSREESLNSSGGSNFRKK